MKNRNYALALSIMTGTLGLDRFYLGYKKLGIVKLLTFGLFGILYMIDIVRIANGTLRPADGSGYEDEIEKEYRKVSAACDYLEKITKLYEQGDISDEEYNKMRADFEQFFGKNKRASDVRETAKMNNDLPEL